MHYLLRHLVRERGVIPGDLDLSPKWPDPEPEDKRVKPPDLDDSNKKDWQHSDWWRFDKPMEEGDKGEMYAMAARMMGVLATQGSDWDGMLFWLRSLSGVTGHDIPKIPS